MLVGAVGSLGAVLGSVLGVVIEVLAVFAFCRGGAWCHDCILGCFFWFP